MAITQHSVDLEWTRDNLMGSRVMIPLEIPTSPLQVTAVQDRLRRAIFYGEDINMELHSRGLYPPVGWSSQNLTLKCTFVVLPFPNWDRVFEVNEEAAYRSEPHLHNYHEFEFMKQTARLIPQVNKVSKIINHIKAAYPQFPDLEDSTSTNHGYLEGTRQVYTPRATQGKPVDNLGEYYMLNGWYNVLSKLAGVWAAPRIMLYTGGV